MRSGTPVTHCLTAWGQWAAELLQYTAALPGDSGQWNSCNALPHCLGAVGSGTPAAHRRIAWGQWRRRRRRSACRGPTDDGTWRRPPEVPRRPAEEVLRLTSARVRRISSHTRERSSQQAVWVTSSVYDNATVRSALRSRPPTAPNCPGSTRSSVPRSTGTEDVGLPGHHPRLGTPPDKERGLAPLRAVPERSGRVRPRTGHERR